MKWLPPPFPLADIECCTPVQLIAVTLLNGAKKVLQSGTACSKLALPESLEVVALC